MSDANWMEALIGRVRAGDEAAFRALVERYQHRFQMLIQLGMSEHLKQHYQPEDVLQDLYLEAFQEIQKKFEWRGPGAFLRWMGMLLDHVLADLGKKHSTWKRGGRASLVPLHQDGLDFEEKLAAADPTPGTILRRKERYKRVHEMLGLLAPDYREVIYLSILRELPTKEVAERMNRSSEATYMLLRRALQALGKLFRSSGTAESSFGVIGPDALTPDTPSKAKDEKPSRPTS